ncbi:metal-dependent transcriptional regulator [Gudongella sp. DL1XJH-153]|uniref:metal-dependent transcriptional regulator n=1 Tax=Gudongella sp. DL1XJH-153 TaxID=3409804 RepID=UPI003BB74C47
MNLTESMEMYLETIYLIEKDHGHAHVAEIARELNITKPSVTKAMNHLKDEGFINKQAYGHINLTEKGLKVSRKVFKKHSIITDFLEKSLGLSPADADDNACRMEHVISDEMLEAIKEYLDGKR